MGEDLERFLLDRHSSCLLFLHNRISCGLGQLEETLVFRHQLVIVIVIIERTVVFSWVFALLSRLMRLIMMWSRIVRPVGNLLRKQCWLLRGRTRILSLLLYRWWVRLLLSLWLLLLRLLLLRLLLLRLLLADHLRLLLLKSRRLGHMSVTWYLSLSGRNVMQSRRRRCFCGAQFS